MKTSLRTNLTLCAVALGALGAAAPANARHHHDVQTYVVQAAPVYVPQPVYVPRPVYVDRPVYVTDSEVRGWIGDGRSSTCAAPRWDPQVRYAPGEVVWRRGSLYIAARVSAHVWNVNSPPEWTPNYWLPARC